MNTMHQPMVLICLVCPFIMLLPKPLILRAEAQKTVAQGYGCRTCCRPARKQLTGISLRLQLLMGKSA